MALGAMALAAVPASAADALPPVEVFKNPSCGCCGAWVDHLKAAGFGVKVTLVDDTSVARKKYGLPDKFGSCHTAVVAGYVVEGHVPAADVKKLLAMKPVAVGLTVPGMTMVFKVADPKMIDAIKQGDKVKFAADNVNGALTVTAIEVAK